MNSVNISEFGIKRQTITRNNWVKSYLSGDVDKEGIPPSNRIMTSFS